MHPIVIAFLLGLSPSPKYNDQIQGQWNALAPKEQSVLVRQFEREYKLQIDELTDSDLEDMKRDLKMRTWDLQN